MVVQKPGAVVHAASSPASVRPATSPWASASPQCSTRRRRPARACSRGGDVADGEHRRVRAAHRGVDEHGAVSTSRPASVASSTRGRDAGAEHHEVGRQRLAAVEPPRASAARCARPRRRGGPRRRPRTAASVMSSPAALAQALGLRALLGRDEDDVDAAAHERRRGLAGDEAGADDHRAGARRSPRRAGAGRRRPCGSCAGRDPRAPSIGGRSGAEPVASTQAS